MIILDIHTHHQPPQPNSIVSVSPIGFSPMEGQLYSLGIHPWHLSKNPTEAFHALQQYAGNQQVVAIGEAGIDTLKSPAPLPVQMIWLKRQADLAETLGKPMVIHDVKGHQQIIDTYKSVAPTHPWALHAFRGKPSLAEMFLRAGDFYFSFGEKFNPDALRVVPKERILAETDESELSIEEIIARLSEAYGSDLTQTIAQNSARFLGIEE